ncbi:MAG: copper chaperone PCu(A)C [Pseudomonadota bacterium]|nr:copper chaperone PCu(A)C [Pseudomonadota bacterium]
MRLFQILSVIFSLSFLPVAQADVLPADGASVHFDKAYAYPTAPSQKNGAVFVIVQNLTAQAVNSVRAASPVAGMVELHTHSMEDGHMSMYPVDYFTVPANETHELKPAGDHVMLMMLHNPLKTGEVFPLTFTLDDGSEHTIEANVISLTQ